PGDILDQNGLTERCLHAFSERARDNVGRAARWERCDNGDRSRRIGLCPCDARHGRQRGSARGQMQKISAGKFHFEPPSGHRAAEQRDELAAFHSITSSARASSVGGTSRPIALAALRLITSSNLVDCCTGKSVGFSPLRILPVYTPMRR